MTGSGISQGSVNSKMIQEEKLAFPDDLISPNMMILKWQQIS